MRRTIALAFAALLVTAAPAAAESETRVAQNAAEITVRSADTEIPTDPGVANLLLAREAPDGSLRIFESQPGVPLVAVAPCFLVSAQEASCPGDAATKPSLVIAPGKGGDTVAVDLPAAPARVGAVFVAGGAGLDSISGSAGPDTLFGGDGKALSTVPSPSDAVSDQNDAIWGGGGSDILRGEDGHDYLNGGFQNAMLDPAANTLEGGEGRDFFDAGRTPGPDRFVGGTGADTRVNANTLLNGAALTNGGQASSAGGDTVSYQTRTYDAAGSAGVTADLDGVADDGAAGEGDEVEADVEALTGTLRDDTLTGSTHDNALIGGLGVDRLAGGAGADRFMLKDGVADRCYSKGAGDTVDADLADPNPDECPPFSISVVMPPLFTFNAQPVDETIPYVVLGARLRRMGARVVARVRCPRGARRACRGRLELARARRRPAALTARRYRVRPGTARRVVLRPSRRELAGLRGDRRARLTAVARGTSDIGPTTTSVVRRLSPR